MGILGLAVLSAVAAASSKGFFQELGRQPGPTDLLAGQVHGFHAAYYVAVGFGLASSLIALLLVRQRKGEKITVGPPVG